jgi:glutamine phosphoribosylpyrophosphate amidotransferase
MCGILGLIEYSGAPLSHLKAKVMRRATSNLLKESERRGRSAAGVFVLTDEKASLFKTNLPASKFIQTAGYSEVMKDINKKNVFKAMIGHARQKTKGHEKFNVNNHPIKANRIVGVHNGIIGNDDILFGKYDKRLFRSGEVDSEIIFRLIDLYRRDNCDLVESVKRTCSDISGSYTCAFIDTEYPSYVTIFSSNAFSNAHIYVYEEAKVIAFASEEYILNHALEDNSILDPSFVTHKIGVVKEGFRINILNGRLLKFDTSIGLDTNIGKKKLLAIGSTQKHLLSIPELNGGGCSLLGKSSHHIMTDHCDRDCLKCPYYREQ